MRPKITPAPTSWQCNHDIATELQAAWPKTKSGQSWGALIGQLALSSNLEQKVGSSVGGFPQMMTFCHLTGCHHWQEQGQW